MVSSGILPLGCCGAVGRNGRISSRNRLKHIARTVTCVMCTRVMVCRGSRDHFSGTLNCVGRLVSDPDFELGPDFTGV